MEKIEQGKSYDAGELAGLCGQPEDVRVFEGEKAKVITQDEGNGVVKVLEILRQTPRCPNCFEIIDTIYTSRTVQLKFKGGQWVEEQADRYFNSQCPSCQEEFNDEDLDNLGVPQEIR